MIRFVALVVPMLLLGIVSRGTTQVQPPAQPGDLKSAPASGPSTFYLPSLPTDTNVSNPDSSLLERLAARGWTLQRAVAGKDATEGASLGFVATAHEATVFTADFALIYEPVLRRSCTRVCVSSQYSVEGKLSSDDATSENAWRFRGRWVVDRGSGAALRGVTLFAGAKLEANRDFTTKKAMVEAVLTPTDRRLAIGFLRPAVVEDSLATFRFRWRPFLGIDAGGTLSGGSDDNEEDVIARVVPRVRAELFLDGLSRVLALENIVVHADNTLHLLPLENRRQARNLLVSGLDLQFNKFVGFGLEYTNGEAAPEFERTHTLTGAFTVRFGRSRRN
jgi:hypothetical protein